MGMTNAKVTSVERKSDRDYDVSVICTSDLAGFTLWLPLGAVRELTLWTGHEIASMTDYPEMAEGDWSGVRDSSSETIWKIFNKHVA